MKCKRCEDASRDKEAARRCRICGRALCVNCVIECTVENGPCCTPTLLDEIN